MLIAHCISQPILHAQGSQVTPNAGFYHKGSRADCDQTELTRLRKDVAALQNQARDLQADKRAAELKLFDLKSRMYGWHGSIWRFVNALLKLGVDWSEGSGLPQGVSSFLRTLGLASDVVGAGQAVGSGFETGPTLEASFNVLGQAAHACASRQNCWQPFTDFDAESYSQAVYGRYQVWFPAAAGPGQSSPEQWSGWRNDISQLDEKYGEEAESKAAILNKAISGALFVMNALELQSDLQDAAELSEEIDRLQQRWNTIDAEIDADVGRIEPLVAACDRNKAAGGVSPGPSHGQSRQPKIMLTSLAPNVDVPEFVFRLNVRALHVIQRETDDRDQLPYPDILRDLGDVTAKLRDAQNRMDRSVMPALAPFFAGTWNRMDRGVLIGPLQTARTDIQAVSADLRGAREGSQRVVRALGQNANLGSIAGQRVAVTPIVLGSEVSFADANAERHLVGLREIGTAQRRVRLEVQSTRQSFNLSVGDSATVTLDRWGMRRVRIIVQAVAPFGVALVVVRALPPRVLVDLDATTLGIAVLAITVVVAAFLLGYMQRAGRRLHTS
jgi:hypothetical protein